MKRLTIDEIEAGKTRKGGFSRKQLAEWGVPWPPPHGWKDALLTGSYDHEDEDYDFRGDMTVVELHDLFRKVVSAVVEKGHADDLYGFPEVLAYFGAQNPDMNVEPMEIAEEDRPENRRLRDAFDDGRSFEAEQQWRNRERDR